MKTLPFDCTSLDLLDAHHQKVKLSDLCRERPVVLVFYPGDFTPVCTKQLCEYRDNYADLQKLGVRVIGVSADSADKHAQFRSRFELPFELMTDPHWKTAKALGCTSPWMLGMVSRSIGIVRWMPKLNQAQLIFREIEKLAFTRMPIETLIMKVKEALKN